MLLHALLPSLLPQATPAALDLLAQLVSLDPSRRLTAAAALAHPYFSEAPVPTSKEALPRPSQRCRGMLQVGLVQRRARLLTMRNLVCG
jgi:serine/threonine protein kinase